MSCNHTSANERALLFRTLALPCVDDAYRFACFLMQNRSDAEDCVQKCYLRALRHFDKWRGPAIEPWLLTILRSVCYSKLARGDRQDPLLNLSDRNHLAENDFCLKRQAPPECISPASLETALFRRLIASLPLQSREVVVLRDLLEMSYLEIAEITGVRIDTVMLRLAHARALLVAKWKVTDSDIQGHSVSETPASMARSPTNVRGY